MIATESEFSLEYLLQHTAQKSSQPEPKGQCYISSFIVEIKITKVNKHIHLPLIVVKDKTTHTNLNTNDAVGHIMVLDNIMLTWLLSFSISNICLLC